MFTTGSCFAPLGLIITHWVWCLLLWLFITPGSSVIYYLLGLVFTPGSVNYPLGQVISVDLCITPWFWFLYLGLLIYSWFWFLHLYLDFKSWVYYLPLFQPVWFLPPWSVYYPLVLDFTPWSGSYPLGLLFTPVFRGSGSYRGSGQTPGVPSVTAGHGGAYWPSPPTPWSPETRPPQPHTAAAHHHLLQPITNNIT